MSSKYIHGGGESGAGESAISRRCLLKAGGAAALAAGIAPSMISGQARAQQKTLKILQWKHFVPSHDRWFDEYVKEWGQDNDIQVVVDHVAIAEIDKLAKAEMAARRGHDLILFVTPPAQYEDYAIDHYEIYEECERKWKKPLDFSLKSTYNPKTKQYFGFCGAFLPAVISYRKDLWDAVAAVPESWDNVLEGDARSSCCTTSPWDSVLPRIRTVARRCEPSCTPSAPRSRTRGASQH